MAVRPPVPATAASCRSGAAAASGSRGAGARGARGSGRGAPQDRCEHQPHRRSRLSGASQPSVADSPRPGGGGAESGGWDHALRVNRVHPAAGSNQLACVARIRVGTSMHI